MLYHNTMPRLYAILCITTILFPALLFAADTIPFEPTPAKVGSVPQNLLKLVHAPEVQKELELAGDQLASFEEALSKIDGPWWKARIKPESEQRTIIAAQEALLIKLLKSTLSPEKLRRLQQIELQSQGTRLFARPEIAQALGLSKSQTSRLNDVYASTDKVANKLLAAKSQDKTLISDLQSAREAESKTIVEVLTEKQKNAFSKLMGTPFDTMKLSRV
jgi:hypothetical protein